MNFTVNEEAGRVGWPTHVACNGPLGQLSTLHQVGWCFVTSDGLSFIVHENHVASLQESEVPSERILSQLETTTTNFGFITYCPESVRMFRISD